MALYKEGEFIENVRVDREWWEIKLGNWPGPLRGP